MLKRKRIGIYLAYIDRYYQFQIVKGIQTYCETHDWDLLFFSGRSIQSPAPNEAQNNAIYELINTQKLDGLIVTSGTLANYVGAEAFITFMQAYKDIPIISLSMELPGMTSLILDNKASLRLLMEHLTQEHDYKKYAYISGPRTNQEAVERLECYIEVLKEKGIEIDEDLIYEGNHGSESGMEAINHFYRVLNKRPDVIVAGNDDMAMGAYKALNALGIKVPTDVAITGFDGTERVESFYLPITTIRQPLFEMGYQAGQSLMRTFSNQPVEPIILLNGSLIVGESCGCFDGLQMVFNSPSEINGSSLNEARKDFCQLAVQLLKDAPYLSERLLNALEIRSNSAYYVQSMDLLIKAFSENLMDRRSESQLLFTLNRIIQNDVDFMESRIEWQNVLIVLKKYFVNQLPNSEVILWADELFFRANTLVGRIMIRKERSNDFAAHLQHAETSLMIHSFTSVTTLDGMLQLIQQQVINWQFSEMYICLYPEPILFSERERFVVPEKIHLYYGINNGQELLPEVFEAQDMLPSTVLDEGKRLELVFQPLFFRYNQFGYMVTDVETNNNILFMALKEQICNLLERKMLIDKLEATNSQLQVISRMDALTGLYNRRGFYEFSETAYQYVVENGLTLSVIYGDLDGLKMVNDRYGHYEGDVFIQTIARLIKESSDKDAIIGRVGGDEFIICLVESTDGTLGVKTLEKIRQSVKTFNKGWRKNYPISLSLGMSQYDPKKPKIFEELIKKADANLYIEKRKKKSC